MRRLLALVTIGVVGVGLYAMIQDRESRKVKQEMLRLVDDLDLTPAQRGRVRMLVEAEHSKAFTKALDVSKSQGHRFDAELYQNEIFAQLIAHIQTDDADLAERLSTQQHHHRLVVTER